VAVTSRVREPVTASAVFTEIRGAEVLPRRIQARIPPARSAPAMRKSLVLFFMTAKIASAKAREETKWTYQRISGKKGEFSGKMRDGRYGMRDARCAKSEKRTYSPVRVTTSLHPRGLGDSWISFWNQGMG